MKKLLIGTTALVAGGLIAGSVMAAEIDVAAPEVIDDGFEVTMTGYIRAGFYGGTNDCSVGIGQDGFSSAGVAGTNNAAGDFSECLQRDGTMNNAVDTDGTAVPIGGELQINANQTLANGLRIGGEIDFGIDAGESTPITADELWIYIEGTFGEVRLGQKDGASDALSGGSLPGWGVWNGSTNGPDMQPLGAFTVGASTDGDNEDFSGDQLKVTYYTPTIAGIDLGVSYTPDVTPDDADGNVLAQDGETNGEFLDSWEFGAKTKQVMGEYTLNLGFAYAMVNADRNNTAAGDRDLWKIAGSIKSSMGGVGAFYSSVDRDVLAGTAANADETTDVWGIVANFIQGDYTVGGGYTSVRDDKVGASWTDDELDIWGFGIAKDVGTGVQMGVNATFMDASNSYNSAVAGDTASEADGWLAGVFVGITF